MAIGSTAQWGSNVVIKTAFEPSFISTVYRQNDLLPLFPEEESNGDTDYRWKVNSAGNTSVEVYTEGSTQPTPVAQTYVNANLAYIYFRAMVQYTGHARDALKKGGLFPGLNAIDEEFRLGSMEIRDLMNTTFMGTGNNGLELAVDSSGTYAGINRASATHWQSLETAVSGALAHGDIMDLREGLKDNERGANMRLLLCPWNQVTNIQNLAGTPGQANAGHRFNLTSDNGALNLAPRLAATQFAEADVVGIADTTDTVIFGLDLESGIKTVVHRRFDVRQDIAGDDDVFQLSTAATIVVSNPRRQGKLTAVTA